MSITLPEDNNIPTVLENEDFLEMGCSDGDVLLNLKFETYELDFSYPVINPHEEQCEMCGDPVTMAGTGIPELTIKDGNKCIFNMNFNRHWVLLLTIDKNKINEKTTMYTVYIDIHDQDNYDTDGEGCEICENNDFHFTLTSIVDSYTFYLYKPPRGEYEHHPPNPKEELDESVLEGLK